MVLKIESDRKENTLKMDSLWNLFFEMIILISAVPH